MQGHPDVINYLVTLLKGELAARDQYFIHSRMYEDWGLSKLYERINHEMEEETQHADALMRRILMLEGTPDMRADDLEVGSTVPEMIELTSNLNTRCVAPCAKALSCASCTRTTSAVTFFERSWLTPRKITPIGWKSSKG